jgi:streptogramin lyase
MQMNRIRVSVMVGVLICLLALAAQRCFGEGMDYPLAVVAGPDNSIYVADRNLPGIWKIQEGKAKIYYQGSKKFRTPLNAVRCLAIDVNGKLLAGDSSTREVYRFDTPETPVPMTKGGIGIPTAIAIDSKGNLFVADLELHCIFQVPAAGGAATEFVKVPAPRGIAIDAQDRVWVVSHSKEPVVRFAPNKSKELIVSETLFQFAHQICVDAKDDCYITDGYAKSVWKVPAKGKPEKFFSGEPLKNPVGLAMHGERLLIADPHQKMIYSLPIVGDKVIQAELR